MIFWFWGEKFLGENVEKAVVKVKDRHRWHDAIFIVARRPTSFIKVAT